MGCGSSPPEAPTLKSRRSLPPRESLITEAAGTDSLPAAQSLQEPAKPRQKRLTRTDQRSGMEFRLGDGVSAVAIAIDLSYRATTGGKRWFSPRAGDKIFFIPIWVLGIVAIVGAPFVHTLPR